ncbi:MAG: hypothetical protein ACP5JH_03860 [Bacteroidota bacterium]
MQLEGSELAPLFPMWHEPTMPLAQRMITAGVEAIITCVNPRKLRHSFARRRFGHAFFAELPQGVDPCRKNGEFHTCLLPGSTFRGRLGAVLGSPILPVRKWRWGNDALN